MQTPSFFSPLDAVKISGSYPTANFINLAELPSTKLYFIDVNPDFGSDGKDELVYENDAIKVQIRNILSTPTGSEQFEPEYGSLLPWRLFEPINARTAWQIENDTLIAVNRWMAGRIKLTRQQCYVRPLDEGIGDGYYISLVYTILRTKVLAEYKFSVYR